MTIVFPTWEDKETLLSFARNILCCNQEDIELLNSTCVDLITDAQAITEFVFAPSFRDSEDSNHYSLPVATLPVNYYRSGIPDLRTLHGSPEVVPRGMPRNVHVLLHQHEASLRAMRHRLLRGRDALKGVNEKYDYAFTVVTFGKSKTQRQPILQRQQEHDQKESRNGKGDVANTLSDVADVAAAAAAAAGASRDVQADVRDDGTVFPFTDTKVSFDTRQVREVYTKFIFAFDAYYKWAACIVGLIDGEGSVPEPGRYVVSENDSKRTQPESHPQIVQRKINPNSGQETEPGSAASESGSTTSMTRTRTVHVTRYEVHDVSSIYRSFERQASFFYLSQYTAYDARVERRLLIPAYYGALRDTLREIGVQIDRLHDLQNNLRHQQRSSSTIVFRPSLCDFEYLLHTLRLYWSSCVTEDDLTSLQYHRLLYTQYVEEAGEVLKALRQLRHRASASGVIWVPLPEEEGALQAAFESFWGVRRRVLDLRDSIARSITEKNRTHQYRISTPAASEQTSERQGGSVAQQTLAMLRSWAQLVSCEVNFADSLAAVPKDDEGVTISMTSPFYKSKVELQRCILRLATAVETEATTLERDYKGVFFRDAKAQWMKRADGVRRQLESVSVVFSRPG